MIHELLFHLYKKPLYSNEYSNLFDLQEFLHPAEKNLILKILEIPNKYYKVVNFIRIINDGYCENNEETEYEKIPKGLYIKAFAYGLDQSLKPYRDEVISLESSFLQNPQLPLTYILFAISKYQMLFDDLYSMIDMVVSDKLCGCILIGRLQKYLHSGTQLTSNAAKIIIKALNTRFCHQLSNWVIFGEIVDTNNEFFIRDEACPDPNFLYDERHEENKGMRLSKPPVVRKFSIDWKMVPIFISEDLVESILFMGRIVWILNNGPNHKKTKSNERCTKKTSWDGKEMEYWRKIENLQNQTIKEFEFSQIIEECRLKLTKHMLSLMLEEGNVKEHLQLIRDYYALGRGELFQQFMISFETHSKNFSNSNHDIVNINLLFMETAKQMYGENDMSYEKFELIITDGNIMTTNLWSRLELNFEIKWPLHIIFHPKSMELYKKLFSYLLRFKKTQTNLHRLWLEHMSRKQKIDRRLWTLRHNLTFLINNLYYYLQVDVIEANFSVLEKGIRNAEELEDVIRKHHEFISTLLSKTFVLDADEEYIYENKHKLYQNPAVHNVPSRIYRAIMTLLELCDDFSIIALTWETVLTETEVIELEDFQRRADLIITTLLTTLFNLRKKERGDHLFQLLDQLNFNKFFIKNMNEMDISFVM